MKTEKKEIIINKKRELKYVYYEIVKNISYEYSSVLEITKKCDNCRWETVKNCLEVLTFIGIVKENNNKYAKKILIDAEKLNCLWEIKEK